MCSLLTASQGSSCPAPDAATHGRQGRAEPNAPGDAAQTRVTNLCSKQLSKSSLLVRNLSGYPQASFLLRMVPGCLVQERAAPPARRAHAHPAAPASLRHRSCPASSPPSLPKKQLQQHRRGTALFLPLSCLKQKWEVSGLTSLGVKNPVLILKEHPQRGRPGQAPQRAAARGPWPLKCWHLQAQPGRQPGGSRLGRHQAMHCRASGAGLVPKAAETGLRSHGIPAPLPHGSCFLKWQLSSLARSRCLRQAFLARHKLQEVCPMRNEHRSSLFENH